MSVTASYHTHNDYCDGKGSIQDMVEAALAVGLTEIGISSHAPLPFETAWTMPPERLREYVAEVREVGRRYTGRIRVLLGLEVDFIPGDEVATFQLEQIAPLELDYVIGSVHFLGPVHAPSTIDGQEESFRRLLYKEYGGDIRTMVEEYYRRIPGVLTLPHVRIVGHLDRIKRWNADGRYFSGDEPWYGDAVEGALRAIGGTEAIMEVNTSGWRNGLGEPYPSADILTRAQNLDIAVLVSADAHSPDQVIWAFDETEALMAGIGVTPTGALL